jgi:hypothetical protein
MLMTRAAIQGSECSGSEPVGAFGVQCGAGVRIGPLGERDGLGVQPGFGVGDPRDQPNRQSHCRAFWGSEDP